MQNIDVDAEYKRHALNSFTTNKETAIAKIKANLTRSVLTAIIGINLFIYSMICYSTVPQTDVLKNIKNEVYHFWEPAEKDRLTQLIWEYTIAVNDVYHTQSIQIINPLNHPCLALSFIGFDIVLFTLFLICMYSKELSKISYNL